MNWPNRLTLLRMAVIPVCSYCILMNEPVYSVWALVLFVFASITDFLDGHLARKHKIITTLGKFLDPVADKLLVLTSLIALSGTGHFPTWIVIVILCRELLVDGLRMVAVGQNQVIVAGKLGKIKTVLQMMMVIAYLVHVYYPVPQLLLEGLNYAVVIMTIYSGVDYFWQNRKVFQA